MLDGYISECMDINKINNGYGIKEPTRGYQICIDIQIVGISSWENLYIVGLTWYLHQHYVEPYKYQVWLYLGMKNLAWHNDSSGIENK